MAAILNFRSANDSQFEQKSAKLARNVHWMVLYQICVFGADLKSNMAARVHNVFSLTEILKIFLSKRFTILVQDHPMIIPAKSQFN
jgi:hypothetical protein